MTLRSILALSLLAATACSDPSPPAGDCASFAEGVLVRATARASLVVASVTPRYDGGRLHELTLADRAVRPLPVESTGDTVVRPMGEAVAILHRAVGDQDNLTLFARGADGGARVCQVSLLTAAEEGAAGPRPWVNAHDALALDARTVVVTRYRMSSLAVVDVATGRVTRSVDLGPWRGAAMGAWPDAVARVGPELWVVLGRNDLARRDFPARGAVARLDPRTLAVTGVVELPRANPVGALHASPDGAQRWVATAGSYEVIGDGAVEAIDVATGRVVDPVVTESEVGGNIDALAVVDARRVVLRVTAELRGGTLDDLRLVLFDRVTRTLTTLLQMSTWGAAAPVVVGDQIVAGDPGSGAFRAGAGLRFFTREGATAGFVRLGDGLFPYDAQAR